METQKGFMDKCSECGSTNLIYDYNTDETICGGCGLVIHEQMGLSTAIDRVNLLTMSKAREKIYTSRHAARLVGIHFRTFKRWIYNNIVSVSETPGGKYYVSESEICRLKKLLGNPRKKRFYSGKQASEIIGVGTLAVKCWISSGEMSAGRTPSGEYCIPESEIGRLKRLVSSKRSVSSSSKILTVSNVEDKVLTVSNVEEKILQYWRGGVKKLTSGEAIDVRGGGNSEERDSDIEVYQFPFGRRRTCPYCGRTLGKEV